MSNWLPLIRQALLSEIGRTNSPVSGSKLRAEVGRLASAAQLDFPPPEFPKFSTLLEQFPESVIVQRRPGKDVLVVPTDRPELLAVERSLDGKADNWLRIDVFDAFTKIPSEVSGKPIYLPGKDEFAWANIVVEVPADAVEVAASSLQSEILMRQDFVKTVHQEKAAQLAEALATQTPLKDFSQALHSTRLLKDWHRFRLASLIERVKSWAIEKGLTWRATWLDTADSKREVPSQVMAPPPAFPRHALAELISGLSSEDLRRINVPLDLVIRMLERR